MIQAYLKKIETFQINNLTLNLREQEKEEQMKPRVSYKKGNKHDQSRTKWQRLKQTNKQKNPKNNAKDE